MNPSQGEIFCFQQAANIFLLEKIIFLQEMVFNQVEIIFIRQVLFYNLLENYFFTRK